MILLNPGPCNVSDRVRLAAAIEPLCHREPEYFDIQDEVRRRLVEIFRLESAEFSPVLVTGSGTSAVEAMIASGVPKGARLLVVDNGVYGDRMVRIAEAYGIAIERLAFPWDRPADPALVEAHAEKTGAGAIALVHNETTTGLINPIAPIAGVARKVGARLLVDSVSGLGGESIDVASVDFAAGTAGKCLQGLPGVSFVLARRAFLTGAPRRSVYFDLAELSAKQDRRNTPFTPAIPIMNAFREALRELAEEGLEDRISRYAAASRFLREGFARIGLEFWLPPGVRSNTITTLRLPEGKTYAALHDTLKEKGFVIYAGQGNLEKEAFRICNMGWIPHAELERLLAALEEWIRG